ncbi:hypothetical protein [Synechococcus sp. CB0101]|nr:hypothetical protein [Synechococcus sp. CB0101]
MFKALEHRIHTKSLLGDGTGPAACSGALLWRVDQVAQGLGER